MLSWLNKIKPFLDAYYAPYKKKTRYWTGLLLLVRCILFLVFAFDTLGNTNISMVMIVSFTAGLAALSWLHGGIYEKLHNDIIEASFLLNLIIFAAATDHVKDAGRKEQQVYLANTSIGIALTTFLIILLYHCIVPLLRTTPGKKLTEYMMSLIPDRLKGGKEEDEIVHQDQVSVNKVAPAIVCVSSIELRESMLTD